ncbi:MAG: cation:dicarboxylase symporter family transporter [Magnetococcales bacterium]|nr:cation:dicarboxylase symporter family transporter [Magnetococcales bacterium]
MVVRKTGRFLLNPWTILLSVVVGTAIGLINDSLARQLAPFGNLYLNLLKMSVTPILISAIAVSVGRLIHSRSNQINAGRVLFILLLGLVLCSLMGAVVGMAFDPGKETRAALGGFINQSPYKPDLEISLAEPYVPSGEKAGLVSFLSHIVPANIFSALNEGQNLKVLFTSILMGIALGALPKRKSEPLLVILDAVYQSFGKLIQWFMYLLPFGLLAMLADQVSQIGFRVIEAMMGFIVAAMVCFLFMWAVSVLIIWHRSHSGLLFSIHALQETLLISLSTRSSVAAIPSALSGMRNNLRFNAQGVDLLVPLSISVCRFGNVLYFALCTQFVAHLYQSSLSLGGMAMIIGGSIFAGMATAGSSSGIVSLSMLEMVLTPLGLPAEAVLVLFFAVDSLVDPARTVGTVYASCAATALITDLEQPGEA